MNKETIEKIKSLINVFAVTVGIILLSIGSVMVLNPVLKMYVFGLETRPYFDAERDCLNDIKYQDEKTIGLDGEKEKKNVKSNSEIKKTEEYKTCLVEKTKKEKERFKEVKKIDMADGIAFILVSLIILAYYRVRKEKK